MHIQLHYTSLSPYCSGANPLYWGCFPYLSLSLTNHLKSFLGSINVKNGSARSKIPIVGHIMSQVNVTNDLDNQISNIREKKRKILLSIVKIKIVNSTIDKL